MGQFRAALQKEILRSTNNFFGVENYDEYRFGAPAVKTQDPFLKSLKRKLKQLIGYRSQSYQQVVQKCLTDISKYEEGLDQLYKNINDQDKALIVKLVAYRLLGYKRVKLPVNNKEYWRNIGVARTLKIPGESYDPHFRHFILEKFDLNKIGYDLKIYFGDAGIVTDFMIEQYAYKLNNETKVQAEKDDVVLDIGACWGDTALYFAAKVGEGGKVFSFEFIPDNIKLYNLNVKLNPRYNKVIELVPHPVSGTSGQLIYYKDNGPGSKVMVEPFEGQTGSTRTITVDDFVKDKELSRVDFIKMDIEGAEPLALHGAIETIKKFKPKLAISIYHSMEDFVNIPQWILNLNLDYDIYIGHYTIHAEETVCFAKPKSK